MTADDREEAPGLQRERTALAWDRTGLGFIVAGALLLRIGGSPYHHPRHAPAALAVAFGAALVYGASWRYRRNTLGRSTGLAAPAWWVRTVGIVAVAFSAAALVVVVAGA
jgi:uncharacterized membrane protein YidH (DUF202 family)